MSAAQAGIVVYRSDAGIQFAEAVSLAVNGKDKVLSLGPDAKLNGPAGKLPSQKLGGTLLKDAASGVPAFYEDGALTYVYPAGLPKNSPDAPAAVWAATRISYKKSTSDKAPSEVTIALFMAFLPEGVEELARLCNDDKALGSIGGANKVFATRIELMSASVKAYSADPALAPLEKHVEQFMRTRYEQFETGTVGIEALEQAIRMAELSLAVYPKQPEQIRLRQQIADRKKWIDRRVAILRAFSAANEWDAFLLGDREVEKYERAFPEVAGLHAKALKASLDVHRQSGEELLKDREFEAAFREFRLAGSRQPSDRLLQQRAVMSWSDYSREVAIENRRGRKQIGTGEREILNQAIQFATNYARENKLDLALKSVLEAEAIDPDSLPMLLKKAEILGAQRQFSEALATLDRYDLRAIEDEREKASSLRNDLLFKRTSSLEDIKSELTKAWAQGSYHRIHDLAVQGLHAKDDDADLLYQAGTAGLITRQRKESREFFNRYLNVSNTLDADSQQRARVRTLLANFHDAAPVEDGEANWLSGKKLPNTVYYCPVSLAFQPRIDRIEASGKMKVAYEWDGGKLVSITPSFEKLVTGERRISFLYDERFPQVAAASDGDIRPRRAVGTDPDSLVKSSSVVILNNPYIDPDAVEKLTGKNVTVGISGNRFFEPFVWDKVHYFRFRYDFSGRVAEAREIADPNAAPGDFRLEFEWDGMQLTAIRGYQGPEKRASKVYERTMQYQDGRLVSEEIQGQGKSSKIKYAYNGSRLVSATCSTDPTLDDRSRQVTFR